METCTTFGITVSVTPFYQPALSKPLENKFIFSYRVTIDNQNPYTVQLIRRHWHILDSNGAFHEVEGEGVVGQQPVLQPGERHEYHSWAPIKTELGLMFGTYTMLQVDEDRIFKVKIPEFQLVAPQKLN
jgi:ApaG protein